MSWQPVDGDTSIRMLVRRLMVLARLVISWERLWPAIWPSLGIIGIFVTLALLGALTRLPGWLHAFVLVALVAALVSTVVLGLRSLRMPTAGEVQRRLETESELQHRPLVALDDVLIAGQGDNRAEAMWRTHRKRTIAALKHLRVGYPSPGLARHDPWALRIAVALALFISVVIGGSEWQPRLARAVMPDITNAGSIVPVSYELWVAPPDYTGVAPLLLDIEALPEDKPTVPSGSLVMAQVHDGRGTPELIIGPERHPLKAVDIRTWRAEVSIEAMEPAERQLVLKQGNTDLGTWPIRVMPDEAPTIEFASDPKATQRMALKLEYSAADDYGLENVTALVFRPGGQANDDDQPIEIQLPLSGHGLKEASTISYHDLTAHPWAGLPVEIDLQARDGPGNLGLSGRFALTLPERIFSHPVAKAIIEQRRRLSRDSSARIRVAGSIAAIAIEPNSFDNDVVVYLALMTAKYRLMHSHDAGAAQQVQAILWDTALRLEEGDMALAEHNLRNLQRQLQDALAKDAPDEEIQRMIDDLRAAIERYEEAMAKNMRQLGQGGGDKEDGQRQNAREGIRPMNMDEIIDHMQELAKMDARAAAQQMLGQLQEMLENLQSGQRMGMTPENNGQNGEMMRAMEDLIRQQQSLMDRTYQNSRQQAGQRGQQPQAGQRGQTGQQQPQAGKMGQQPGQGMLPDRNEQDELRRTLEEIMRQMGETGEEIPGGLGRAERHMLDASKALGEGDPDEAIGPQANALDELQQGAQSMMQKMMSQQDKGSIANKFGRAKQGEPNRDPLGRTIEQGGWWDNGNIRVPNASDLQRARRILEELRRRSGQRSRPVFELEYIERLLRRF